MDGLSHHVSVDLPSSLGACHVNPQALAEWISLLPLSDAGLSLRAQHHLNTLGVRRVGELHALGLPGLACALDDINIGKPSTAPKVIKEVEAFFAEVGISIDGGGR